ncbi:MAG TPA: TonB family protein, partial [Pyrinomonadaceae bacterium]|nr:TonB family protein [Pyrinomonadaceae bacterium]
TPAWQMQAFDADGSRVGETVGEGDIANGNYLFPSVPQDFTINAAGIHKIQLCSKNHLSTFGAIPIARIGHRPAAVSLTGAWWPSEGPPIRFVQQGDRVTGTYRGGRGHENMTGTISGTFDGKTFDGTFENHEGSVSGRGTVTLTLNGDRLEGVWAATSTPGVSGEWILSRREPTASQTESDSSSGTARHPQDRPAPGRTGDAPKEPQPPAADANSASAIDDLNGRLISKPQPAYPAMARAAHVQGTVNVEIVVDENGNVISARALGGPALLQQAAAQAARQAKFSPLLVSGVPVKFKGTLAYNFVLQ